ncbi:MAG: hypothetical protein RLZZ416_160 [Candidatus Parcubacteria bacterium]|jgi:hypothetical protein
MNDDRVLFYFANLGADMMRCALAGEEKNIEEYKSSVDRAYRTISLLDAENQPGAAEEGRLLIRALDCARLSNSLPSFRKQLNDLVEPHVIRLCARR